MIHDVNTDIDAFVDLVRADCPGGIDTVKQRAVIQAMIDFCKQTQAWKVFLDRRVYVDHINPEVDVGRAVRSVFAGAAVRGVDDVWLSKDACRLKKMARADLDQNKPDWAKQTAQRPTGFLMGPGRRLRVYPAPEKQSGLLFLDLELVLIPTLKMTRFPDFIYEMYGDTIAAGAAQRLKSQPAMPWTDFQQAQFFFKKFSAGVREARLDQAQQVVRAINEKRRRSFR